MNVDLKKRRRKGKVNFRVSVLKCNSNYDASRESNDDNYES